MASCTQIKHLVQAYMDGELGQAQRVILEQHVGSCQGCHQMLSRHKASYALLFEVLSEHRLTHDLTAQVMGHLPEMSLHSQLVTETDWRAKHPSRFQRFVVNFMPASAVVLLIILGFALFRAWPPQEKTTVVAVGMVTQADGHVMRSLETSLSREEVALKSVVSSNERFETSADSSMIISLAGPTEMKIAENTRVKINGSRDVNVERGKTWLRVAKDSQRFRVKTPNALVTVFGTVFGVEVVNGTTLVTVQEGEVQVDALDSTGGHDFVLLTANKEVLVTDESSGLKSQPCEAQERLKWARAIQSDSVASELFMATIAPSGNIVIPGEQVFVVRTFKTGVNAFTFAWEPDHVPYGHAGYKVYVYQDGAENLLFTSQIPGSLFNDSNNRLFKLSVPEGSQLDQANALHVKLMPDFTSGQRQISFTSVCAVGG